MGNKGSITVDDKHIGESRRFIPVNNEIIDRYLNKFKKRGAKLEKWESKLSKFLVKHKVASYREPYRNEADLKEIYIAENPPPIEKYTKPKGDVYTSITLNLTKKETEGLINTLSEMLLEIIDLAPKGEYPGFLPYFTFQVESQEEIKEYIGLKKITNKIEKEKKTNLNEQITKKITSKNWEEEIYFKNNLMNQTIISRYDDEELIILKKYYGKRFQKVVEEQITIKSFINQYEENDFPKNRNKYKKFIEVETEKLLRDDLTVDEIMLRLNNNFNLEENEIYSIKEYIINKRNLKQVEEIEKENKVITNRINDLEGKYDIFISETGKNLVGKLRGLMDKDKDKKLATYTKMKKSEKVLSVEEQKSLVEGLVDEIVLEITKTKEELIDCKKENIEETIRIVLDEIIKYMIKTNKVTRDNVELLKEDVMEIIGKIKVEKYKAAPQTMDGFYELLNEYPYIQNQNQMINKENKKETGREPR